MSVKDILYKDSETAMACGRDKLKKIENEVCRRRAKSPKSEEVANYPDVTDDTEIYRYVTADVFLSMIEKSTQNNSRVVGENWLSHISRWEDPFEGLVFKGDGVGVEEINGYGVDIPLRDLYRNYFGQSWTLCGKESDLRWRAYCPNGNGVRICSSIRRLKDSIIKGSRSSIPCGCMFNRVYYLSRDRLTEMLSRGEKRGLEFLFLKSAEFAEEQEYRLVADAILLRDAIRNPNKKMRIESGFLKYELKNGGDSNTIGLFDEVLIDPRMPTLAVERIKSRIAQTGLRCTVKQSQIYQW